MCPIFVGSQLKCIARYQKILWKCSFGWKNLLKFNCHTMKFYNYHHAVIRVVEFINKDLLRVNNFIKYFKFKITSCWSKSSCFKYTAFIDHSLWPRECLEISGSIKTGSNHGANDNATFFTRVFKPSPASQPS